MKLIFLVYNVVIENKVMEELEKAEVEAYTKLPSVHGAGTHSVPRLDSHVWPGINQGLFIAIEEEKKEEVLSRMKKLKSMYEKEGLKVFVLPLEEVI
ncbi:MAG: PG0541 family transporter-associated protein [bacterium]